MCVFTRCRSRAGANCQRVINDDAGPKAEFMYLLFELAVFSRRSLAPLGRTYADVPDTGNQRDINEADVLTRLTSVSKAVRRVAGPRIHDSIGKSSITMIFVQTTNLSTEEPWSLQF